MIIMKAKIVKNNKIEDIKKVKGFFDLNGKNITVQDALVMKAIETAMKGNAKSMKMLFDLMALDKGAFTAVEINGRKAF